MEIMNRILAILNREETAPAVLRVTEAISQRVVPNRVSVLAPRRAEDPSFMPTEEVMTDERRREFNKESGRKAEELRRIFAEWQSSYPTAQNVRWLEVIGSAEKSVGAEASQSDLIIAGHVLRDDPEDVKAALRAALFDAAAPVIVAPLTVPKSVGRHPVIAWEPAQAVEQAIGAARPILVKAERVTIISGNEGRSREVTPPPGLLDLFKAADVAYKMETFDLNGRTIGAALLEEAQWRDADLLIMGAYTHNIFVERMIGGATAELLSNADLPLFMHH